MTPSNDQAQPSNEFNQPNIDLTQKIGLAAPSDNPAAPGIDQYQQTPIERDVLESLADLLGWPTADGVWDLSTRDLGLRRPVEDPADLIRMVEHLMNVGDMIRVAGRSAKVRLVAYEGLSRSVTQ